MKCSDCSLHSEVPRLDLKTTQQFITSFGLSDYICECVCACVFVCSKISMTNNSVCIVGLYAKEHLRNIVDVCIGNVCRT